MSVVKVGALESLQYYHHLWRHKEPEDQVWLCPYCMDVEVEEEDDVCPQCQQNLIELGG